MHIDIHKVIYLKIYCRKKWNEFRLIFDLIWFHSSENCASEFRKYYISINVSKQARYKVNIIITIFLFWMFSHTLFSLLGSPTLISCHIFLKKKKKIIYCHYVVLHVTTRCDGIQGRLYANTHWRSQLCLNIRAVIEFNKLKR